MPKRIIIQAEVAAPWATPAQLETSERATRALIRSVGNQLKEIIMTAADRTNAALENIDADVTRLTAAAAEARAEVARLLADQDAEVAAKVDAVLAPISDRAAAIAARTPEPAPVDPGEPVQPPVDVPAEVVGAPAELPADAPAGDVPPEGQVPVQQ